VKTDGSFVSRGSRVRLCPVKCKRGGIQDSALDKVNRDHPFFVASECSVNGK
jgi:hypothetical protein